MTTTQGERGEGEGARLDDNSAWYLFRIPMIHRFMTSHPVAKLFWREALRWTPDAIWFPHITPTG